MFVDLDYTINLNPSTISGAASAGAIFTKAAVTGKIPFIESPGGLLIWKCTNLSASNANTLVFEILLICRE